MWVWAYLPFGFIQVQICAEHSASGGRDSNPNLGGRGWVGLDYLGIIGVALCPDSCSNMFKLRQWCLGEHNPKEDFEMNYDNVVSGFRSAASADGAAVNALVEARTESGFNADAFMGAIELMLIELVVDGTITEGTAKTRKSMIRKLACCNVDVLIDAAAQAAGLSAVYKLVCDSTAKTTNVGAKKKKKAETTAAAAAAPVEPVSLSDVLLIMQNIRNVVLPRLSSDMGLLEDCDAFMATLRAKAGKAGK